MRPFERNSVTQAKARTRTEIQSGTSTHRFRTVRWRSAGVA